jgi:hypothetical protein
MELTLFAAYNPTRVQVSFTMQRKPEITHTFVLFMPKRVGGNIFLVCKLHNLYCDISLECDSLFSLLPYNDLIIYNLH